MINTVTTSTNNNVVVVTAPGPSGPVGPIGPIGPAGTISNNSGVTITPFLSVGGLAIITGSLIVSGSNTFINIGPAQFTGSTDMLGNLTVLGTSSATLFSGSGAGLTNIPAAGITGLNLSRIASGVVSASVATGGTAFTLNTGGTNLFTVSNTGLGTFAGSLTAAGAGTFGTGLTVNGSTTNINQGLVVANGATLNGGTTIGTSLSVNGTATVSNLTVNAGGVTTLNGTATLNGAPILTSATVSTNRITDLNISASVSATGKAFSVNNGATELASVDQQGSISGSGLNITSGIYDTVIDTPNIRLEGNATLNGQPITTAGDLTLNQIKSGAVTASVSTGADSFTLENAGVDLFKVSNTGAVTVSQSINIGRAEDGDYTDGLYTDVTSDTTVGTMIDRFNEVLKGLSPAPAPDLDNIQSTSTGGTALLGFGASQPTSSYFNVTGIGTLGAVDFKGSFSPSGNKRLGVFATKTNIVGVLNEDIPANGEPFVNYPANAFLVPVDGGEQYQLEINGAVYTIETTSGTNALTTATFNLSSANIGSFPATGLPFTIFRHRTGNVTIPQAAWRNGYNYLRVIQGSNTTNYVDWVYDPAAASGNFPYSFTGVDTGSVSPTGQKNLSGIKYYTGFSYVVTGTIGNFYKNVYSNSARSFSSLTSGLSATAVSIPNPTTADSTIPINSTHTFASSEYRLLNQTLTSTLSFNNGFGKSGTTGAITTPTILLDNNNTSNSTSLERFCLEDYRVISASYNLQSDASSAIGTYPSSDDLGASELAVYSGALRYPTRVLNGGDVAGANVVYAIADQPDYSGATEDRWFFRVFRNGGSTAATPTISITGTEIDFTNFLGSLSGDAVKIWLKVPGRTGWRDVLTPAPSSTGGSTADNLGCLRGDAPANIGASSTTRTIGIDLKTEAINANEYFLIRVQASSGWTGTISQISITGI